MRDVSPTARIPSGERGAEPLLLSLSSRAPGTGTDEIGGELELRFLPQQRRDHGSVRAKRNAVSMAKHPSTSSPGYTSRFGIAPTGAGLHTNVCRVLEWASGISARARKSARS